MTKAELAKQEKELEETVRKAMEARKNVEPAPDVQSNDDAALSDTQDANFSDTSKDTDTAPVLQKGLEVSPAKKEPEVQSSDKLQNAYSTLKGKYNAETERWKKQVEKLKAEVMALKEAQSSSSDDSWDSQDSSSSSGMTAEEVQALVDRKVAEALAAQSDTMLDAVRNEVGTVTDITHRLRSEAFWKQLDSEVVDWKTINGDTKWLGWLNNKAPLGRGKTYQNMLDEAQNDLDAEGVAAVFKLFKKEQGLLTNQNGLEKKVSPSKSGSGGSGSTGSPQLKTVSEMNELDARITAASRKGHHAEAEKLMAELDATLMAQIKAQARK